jgi:hypothetical protein
MRETAMANSRRKRQELSAGNLTLHGRFTSYFDAKTEQANWRADGWEAQIAYVAKPETEGPAFYTIVVGRIVALPVVRTLGRRAATEAK